MSGPRSKRGGSTTISGGHTARSATWRRPSSSPNIRSWPPPKRCRS